VGWDLPVAQAEHVTRDALPVEGGGVRATFAAPCKQPWRLRWSLLWGEHDAAEMLLLLLLLLKMLLMAMTTRHMLMMLPTNQQPAV
jgi:hypothetical protein